MSKDLETSESITNYENKVKEYEHQLHILKEENKEKDYSINIFLREMNELLQAHEQNSMLD